MSKIIQVTQNRTEGVPIIHLQNLDPEFRVKLDPFIREQVHAPIFDNRERLYRSIRRSVSYVRIDRKYASPRRRVAIEGQPVRVKEAIEVARRLRIPLEEFEKHVLYIKKGPSANSTVLHSSLPIIGNDDYAFLIGLFQAAGGVRFRDRDPGLRFRVDKPTADEISEVGKRLGETPTVALNLGTYKHSAFGTFHHHRTTVYFSKIMQVILQNFGLEMERTVEQKIPGRKVAMRERNSTIPTWITTNRKYLHSYIEGYLNSFKLQSCLYGIARKTATNRDDITLSKIAVSGFYLRFLGLDHDQVRERADIVVNYLKSIGISGYYRPLARKQKRLGKRMTELEYLVHSAESMANLAKQFRIMTPYARARLHLIMSQNDLLLKIMQRCGNDESVLLGIIHEEPRSLEEIKSITRLEKKKLNSAIANLLKLGVIQEFHGVFRFHTEKFRRQFAAECKEEAAKLVPVVAERSSKIFYKCEKCKLVVETEDHCGQKAAPMPRTVANRPALFRMRRLEKWAATYGSGE